MISSLKIHVLLKTFTLASGSTRSSEDSTNPLYRLSARILLGCPLPKADYPFIDSVSGTHEEMSSHLAMMQEAR